MKDPARFCAGAVGLDRFPTQIMLLFGSRDRHLPRGDPDKVYAENLRETQMTRIRPSWLASSF